MKRPRITRRAWLCAISGLIALLLMWIGFRDWYLRRHPEVAFRLVTGRDLPAGVQVTSYDRKLTDNLFHATHFWLLSGTPHALRQVTDGTGFVESEDARALLPEALRLFGLSGADAEMATAFEWEAGRDRWYGIMINGTAAIYVH